MVIFFRLWIHSRMNWHVMLLSESTLLLGSRDIIQSAAVRECPWAAKFLGNLGTSFSNWIRVNRSNPAILTTDREFYRLELENCIFPYYRKLIVTIVEKEQEFFLVR